jgi:hypothetical protein
MDERTKVLISLGSAAAANCVPCFEHFFKKALAANFTLDDIQEAAEIGDQVKRGAGTTVKTRINEIIGQTGRPCSASATAADRPCCG